MELAELFTTLAERGLSVRRLGGGLECVGPQDNLTPELKRHLVSHRETLLQLQAAPIQPVVAPEQFVRDPDEKNSLQWWECCLSEQEQQERLRQVRKQWQAMVDADRRLAEATVTPPLPESERPRMMRAEAPKYPPWIKQPE